jgi:hypothetical protein
LNKQIKLMLLLYQLNNKSTIEDKLNTIPLNSKNPTEKVIHNQTKTYS